MRVARQFGFDQGVPKLLLPLGVVGDVWKRFLKSTFLAELRSMNTITLLGAKRMGGCTKLYRKYWKDNVVHFLEYVKGVPAALEVEDVMRQDVELCLPKVKDLVLAFFGARSPYVKEDVLGRVREHLENRHGILEKDVGSSVSLSDQDGEGRAEGVQPSSKHTSKRPAKDAVEAAKSGKRRKTSKRNRDSPKAVQPGGLEEAVRTPRGEVPEAETRGGSEVPSKSLEVIGTATREGLEVPLDSLEAIDTLDQNAAIGIVVNDIWGDEGVSSEGVSHPWKGKSLCHMRSADVVQSEEEDEEKMEGEKEEKGSGDDD
ncbi:hypothetical protein RHMOL_Rhmol12G0094700 [Rhododendron molle]|uniref:Uncharacterized protein n=1 Tax=Rhododendron molle TaxID=49168 RepID=A0ACC0LHE2_RHOML|nr:hypothetical protein RHMOL_Rhmol12G0094700 [Rhododendron molle]